jgi:hypothetical protein
MYVAQRIVESKFMHNFYYMDTSSPQVWAISVIVIKLPKANNDPKGKNLPNIVSLAANF